jgi:hypothetical protein
MPRSIPPPGDQPVALIFRNLELLDRLRYRALLVRRVIDDADELGRRAAEATAQDCFCGCLIGRFGIAQSNPKRPATASVRRMVKRKQVR